MLRLTFACTLIAFSSKFARSAESVSAEKPTTPTNNRPVIHGGLRLELVYRLKSTNGWPRLVTGNQVGMEKLPVQIRSSAGAVALYEWRRASDGARRYELEGEAPDKGWERTARPLCRVWQAPASERR
jgi:hypothetical protein